MLKQFAGIPKTSLSSNAFLIPVMTLVSDTIRRRKKNLYVMHKVDKEKHKIS